MAGKVKGRKNEGEASCWEGEGKGKGNTDMQCGVCVCVCVCVIFNLVPTWLLHLMEGEREPGSQR